MRGSEAVDVVVVGGGPAGSAVAARLAARGHRLLLLDRANFPRPKPCGDCVSPAGVRELAELGVLERVLEHPHTRLAGWRIFAGKGEGFAGTFPTGASGLAVGREHLDAALLAHAQRRGAEVRTGTRVADLLRSGSGAVAGVRLGCGGEVRARLVVGADGLRSTILRRLGLLERQPRLRKLALTARVRDLSGFEGRGELHVGPAATVGIAPIGAGRANVTVVVGEAQARLVAGAREEYYDATLSRTPRTRGARRDGSVLATGPFDWPVRSAVADGAMLVGDAAGYYDPFTGQGIYRALRGAALASEVAHSALTAGEISEARLRPYDEARRHAFGAGETLQRWIEAVVSRDRLFRAASALLRSRPRIADHLVAVTGDLIPVRSLWSPATVMRLLA